MNCTKIHHGGRCTRRNGHDGQCYVKYIDEKKFYCYYCFRCENVVLVIKPIVNCTCGSSKLDLVRRPINRTTVVRRRKHRVKKIVKSEGCTIYQFAK